MSTPIAPELDIEERDDGTLVLRHPRAPEPVTRSMAHLLLERAAAWPDRTLIAEKSDGDWRHLRYAEAVAGCRRVAQWLISQGAGPDRPQFPPGSPFEEFFKDFFDRQRPNNGASLI